MKKVKNIKKEQKLDVVFILDKSGSMGGQVENTISSFNEYLEKEKKNTYETNITTVLFSDKYTVLHDRVNVSKVKPLTKREYYVGGCTALYDALGNTIHNFETKDTDKVIFIIITDGYENASKEYKNEDIKKLIQGHKDYEFIYVGADIDSYAAGSNIGIRKDNIANFKKGRTGTSKLFKAIECFEECVMGESEANWKKELDDYIDENMPKSL
jgi:uncharacterized protein YegL